MIRPALLALSIITLAYACARATVVAPPPVVAVAPAVPVARFAHQTADLGVDPAVTWGVLPNGLRWCVLPNQQPRDKVSLRLQVQSGSLLERDEQRGLAHYLEHMAFNGTTNYPPGELNKRLQPLGLAFGAHTNAHTSYDETVYKLDLPDAKPETLAIGLQVMADFAGGMLIQDGEVTSEKGVILAEMRDRAGPDYRQQIAMLKSLFPGLIVSQRMPIGEKETVTGATPALLKDYYNAWYRPSRMVLTVVGAIEPKATEVAVTQHFSALNDRLPVREEPSRGHFAPEKLLVTINAEAEATGTTVSLSAVRPDPDVPDSRDQRRIDLVESIANRVLDRRLGEWVEKHPDGPIISASGGVGRWLKHKIAQVEAEVRDGRIAEALAVIERERRSVIAFGPTAAEMQVVRADLLAALDASVATKDNRTNTQLASALYRSVFEGDVFLSPEQNRDLQKPWVAEITIAEVAAAMAAAWDSPHRAIIVSGRDAAKAGDATALSQAWTAANAEAPVAPAVVAAATWAYGQRPAAVKPIVSNSAMLGAVQSIYDNGVRANLLHTAYKPGEVLVQIRIDVPPATRAAGLSELTSMAFLSAALGQHDQRQMREALAGTTASIRGVGFGEDGLMMSAGCLPKDLETCLQLIRAYITDPGWRPEAEIQAKGAWHEALAALPTDLGEQVGRRFTGLLVSDAPERRAATPEEAEAATFAVLKPWLMPILSTSPLTITIVGDIDVPVAQELVSSYLGTLPKRNPVVVTPDMQAKGVLASTPPFPSGEYRVTVPGKVAKAEILVAWQTSDTYDIARTRRIGLLAQAMGERLRDKLREELGQAYSPHVSRSASEAYAGFGYLLAEAGVAPENADSARDAIRAVAKRLVEEGIDDALLQQIKPPLIKNLAAQRQQNGYWLNQVLSRSQAQPFRFAWAEVMESDYQAVTAAELSALAKQFLVSEPLIVIGVCPGEIAAP